MTSWLPRYDDWLNAELEQCAREAGEDVDTYVARAVATRMVADLAHADSDSPEELMTHLEESGVFASASWSLMSSGAM